MNDYPKKMSSQLFAIAFIAILAIGLKTGLVFGQCDFDWKLGEGINFPVYALTTWDPDANGPEEELLIAGGTFMLAGDVLANYIAAWDGNSWQPLGSGMNNNVYTLAVYNGELIAGGGFTTAGGVAASKIARWNSSSWQPLGNGMDDRVRGLMVYYGELIAGGNFTTAGSGFSAYWARWGLPDVFTGDLNHDCFVDLLDMDWFTERWLDGDCLYNGWCYEADLNYDLTVNFADFDALAQNWLAGL